MNLTVIKLRSWIYTVLFLAWCTIAGTILLPWLVTRNTTLMAIRIWVRGIMWLARNVAGVHHRTIGAEHIPDGPCIIGAQHQSSYETYRIFLELRQPVLVLKRELIWIPLIGWYMGRGGMVPVDRGAGASAMRKMLRSTDAALARGDQVVIFPEGSRIPMGVQAPYRPGIAAIYSHCKVPLIPMALNSGPLWGKSRVLKLPGTITFQFLPALPADLRKNELLTALRESVEGAGLPDPSKEPI